MWDGVFVTSFGTHIRALVGQTIHRNGLWLLAIGTRCRDLPGASFMYAKFEKNVMSINCEGGCQVVE